MLGGKAASRGLTWALGVAVQCGVLPELLQYGKGRPLLFIHGSAANYTTWNVQMIGLRKEFTLLVYDRAGGQEPDGKGYTVEQHADDAAELLGAEVGLACGVIGSSFGAIVALDLARRYPSLVNGLVLCEPPLAQSDALAPVPDGFACRYDALVANEGGPAAAEFFLRCVLGDDSFEGMPKTFQKRSMALWKQIRSDMRALAKYQVNYGSLREQIQCPVTLVGGARSASFYLDVLESLQLAIPGSELQMLRGAGHMMQVDAHKQFNGLLRTLFAS